LALGGNRPLSLQARRRSASPDRVARWARPAVDSGMSRHEKLLAQIVGGRADANVGFDALCGLLRYLGFEERTRGSHHVFRRAGVEELINLQQDGDKAKVYQVRQVRAILTKYGLTTAEPPEGA
jgi:hypothetical protein